MDEKTKPPGSLGRLEELAITLCGIQHATPFRCDRKHVILFAGDHGVAASGVSAYPSAVTAQMVQNFLAGGAAVNVLARLHGATMNVVDVGVAVPIPAHPGLTQAKIAEGTLSFCDGPAMSLKQCEQALSVGRAQVAQSNADVLALGEMGIANTSSASALLAILNRHPSPAELVGRGTGVDDERLAQKRSIVARAAERFATDDPIQALASVGGFEIVGLVGAMLEAAERRIPVLVDGFIVTVAAVAANRIQPNSLEALIFAHLSEEPGHRVALEHLNRKPLLQLGMRLGEASGAVLAFGLVDAAYRILTEMSSFASAGVSQAEQSDHA